jgi:hypothetical protein
MTTRWPCILLAMFCCLLALAASAQAECAWVLWLNHTGVVAGEELDIWIPLNASPNNPDCQQVLASTLQANRRAANPGDAVTLRGSDMIDIVDRIRCSTLDALEAEEELDLVEGQVGRHLLQDRPTFWPKETPWMRGRTGLPSSAGSAETRALPDSIPRYRVTDGIPDVRQSRVAWLRPA